MKKFIFFILFCFSLTCSAQIVKIDGAIVSSIDGLPVDNVNIFIKGTNIGISSDKAGKFSLDNVKLPAVLSVSHLAFFPQDIALTKDDIKKKNKIDLNIQLSERTTNLSEIIIRDKPIYQLERLVYDFEIDSSNVYIIRNSKDKKLLQIYSFEDYLRNKIQIPDECNEIKYDYSKHLSLKQKDNESYYKLMFDEKKNIKLKKEKYDVIEKGILRIVSDVNNYDGRGSNLLGKKYFTSNNNYFFDESLHILNGYTDCKFFYNYSWLNKCFLLYKIDKYKNELKYTLIYYALYDVDDWLKNSFIRNYKAINKYNPYIDSLYQIRNENIGLFAKVESINKAKKIVDEIAIRAKQPVYIKNMMISPPGDLLVLYYRLSKLRIPVYIGEMSNNLYIFNFENMNLYKLSNNGMPLETIKLDSFFVENDFKYLKEIFTNKEKTRCFIRYDIFGKTQLKEIDLQTGKYIRTITLENQFVEKIRMIGNNIYYTARTDGINGYERGLFKKKIGLKTPLSEE